MLIFSMKWTLKKAVAAVGILVAVAFLAVWVFGGLSKGDDPLITDKASRVEFFAGLGWEVDPESESEGEVIIPETLDEVGESYNALQRKAGFDLEDYRGKAVKKYTYTILNYPSAEKDDIIKADLLVLDGKVIGGDLYSPRLDGFIIGLEARRNVEK